MEDSSKAYIGHIMMAIDLIIWGFNTNFMKIILQNWIHPLTLTFFRCCSSLLIFGIIWFFYTRKHDIKPTRREQLMMMLGGMMAMGINLSLYIVGVSLSRPIDAFVIRTFQPILAIVVSIIVLHRQFNLFNYIGVLLGIGGTIVITLATPPSGNTQNGILGDILIILSTISFVAYLFVLKPYVVKFKGITVMFYMSLASFIVTLPGGILEIARFGAFPLGFETSYFWEFMYVLLIATVLGYFLNANSLRYITPFLNSIYIYALPIVGTAIAIMLRTDQFQWTDVIAFVLILVGFILINLKRKQKKNPFLHATQSPTTSRTRT